MIPVKLGEASWRRQHFDKPSNDIKFREDLDLIYEIREDVQVREEEAKQRVALCYNTRVRERAFQKGDMV